MKNKKFPSYAPLAVVVLAAGIAAAAITAQPSTGDSVATVQAGTVTVVPESSMNSAAAAQSVGIGQSKRISWNASDFPSAKVNITIIRKTGDSPIRYQSLRTLSNIPNTGSTIWTPAAGEIGADTYVEVGCAATTKACQAHISPVSYTVTQ